MKIEDAGKRMPFVEQEEYVKDLMQTVKTNALSSQQRGKSHIIRMQPLRYITVACVACMMIVGGAYFFHAYDMQQKQISQASPLDTYLNNISDEEADNLFYYELEEIEF